MDTVHVASAGQADDSALISNNILQLQHLLQLSLNYCAKYQVTLSPGKTKLLGFGENNDALKYAKLINPVNIDNKEIPFVESAEHVGVVRSVTGNLPLIHERIVKNKKEIS